MDDLVAFLHARLAEDESVARAAIEDDMGQEDGFTDAFEWLTQKNRPRLAEPAARLVAHTAVPGRLLREVETKRALIHWVTELRRTGKGAVVERSTDATLRLLAHVYASHPDYRPEWRP